MENQEIKWVSEAFSMQPSTFGPNVGHGPVIIETEYIDEKPITYYVVYSKDMKSVVAKIIALAANVGY